MRELLENLWQLTLEAAPWLLLGLLLAAVVRLFSDRLQLERWLRDDSPLSTVRAALIGAPLPLCSCGVVPAAMGLRRSGAGRGPTVSFLISTPETGVDSIAVSYGLLGPVFALVRPMAAVVSAIGTGLAASRWGHDPAPDSRAQPETACCSNGGETAAATPTEPLTKRLGASLRYAFVDMLADIGPWMLAGLVVGAVVLTYLPASWLDGRWGYGVSMALMLLIGIPMYVCASASTPIAAGFLAAGVSPGAVLVFLLAGPATNIGTLGILRRELGRKTLVIYLVGVMLSAVIFGLLLDSALAVTGSALAARTGAAMHARGWIALGSVAILGLLAIGLIMQRFWPGRAGRSTCCNEGGCSES